VPSDATNLWLASRHILMYYSIKMPRVKMLHLRSPGPILPGSVSTARARCGKQTCKCRDNPTHRHGPYYRWTGIIDEKKTTVTLTQEEAKECARRIQNFRKLQARLATVIKEALETAPWTQR